MPVTTYEDVRSEMDSIIRALPNDVQTTILATAGVPTVSGAGAYETVTITTASGEVEVGTLLVGSGFAPPADRQNPSAGPDATKADNTPLALLLKALVNKVNEHYANEVRPKVNAAITQINSSHGTSLALLDA